MYDLLVPDAAEGETAVGRSVAGTADGKDRIEIRSVVRPLEIEGQGVTRQPKELARDSHFEAVHPYGDRNPGHDLPPLPCPLADIVAPRVTLKHEVIAFPAGGRVLVAVDKEGHPVGSLLGTDEPGQRSCGPYEEMDG